MERSHLQDRDAATVRLMQPSTPTLFSNTAHHKSTLISSNHERDGNEQPQLTLLHYNIDCMEESQRKCTESTHLSPRVLLSSWWRNPAESERSGAWGRGSIRRCHRATFHGEPHLKQSKPIFLLQE
jgi:hypothetical protein